MDRRFVLSILTAFFVTPLLLPPSSNLAAIVAGQSFSVVHSFDRSDGYGPEAALIEGSDGNFYGTTVGGGTLNKGTIFKVDKEGQVTVLRFLDDLDGTRPFAPLLLASGGYFYGTTRNGGSTDPFFSYGTIFRIDKNGNFSVLHPFGRTRFDGTFPAAGLIEADDGNFYGTTELGGAYSYGTVYRMDRDGNVSVIHSFSRTDGAFPVAPVIQASDGYLYGTTRQGGFNNYGTVFKVGLSGNFTVYHFFRRFDGIAPRAGLIQASDGGLYGTTEGDGSFGFGTIFKIDTAGSLVLLHSFDDYGSDGVQPMAGLLQASDGYFYGTTPQGGLPIEDFGRTGVIFQMDEVGHVRVLHTFTTARGYGGFLPRAALLQASDGKLYGSTTLGGKNNAGVIFSYDLTASCGGPIRASNTDHDPFGVERRAVAVEDVCDEYRGGTEF